VINTWGVTRMIALGPFNCHDGSPSVIVLFGRTRDVVTAKKVFFSKTYENKNKVSSEKRIKIEIAYSYVLPQ
jgi:hypothetical protein